MLCYLLLLHLLHLPLVQHLLLLTMIWLYFHFLISSGVIILMIQKLILLIIEVYLFFRLLVVERILVRNLRLNFLLGGHITQVVGWILVSTVAGVLAEDAQATSVFGTVSTSTATYIAAS